MTLCQLRLTRRGALGLGLRATALLAAGAALGREDRAAAEAPAPVPGMDTGTVIAFSGTDKLLVRNDAGQEYRVQYVGVRGPVGGSSWHERASLFHGPLVFGKRVRLESDGKDEQQGYRLRHVFVEDEAAPIGLAVIRAGWGTAVPFPRLHRFRRAYLEAQLEAMAQGRVLWQPDVFGPAAPWRPPGSTAFDYVPADVGLHAPLEALATVPTGQLVLSLLVPAGPPFLYRDLPDGLLGATAGIGYSVTINSKLEREDVRTIACTVGHEAVHAIDFVSDDLSLQSYGCIDWEVRAFGYEARIWAEFWGPSGKPNATSPMDRAENDVLRYAQSQDLQNMVAYRLDYARRCVGDPRGG